MALVNTLCTVAIGYQDIPVTWAQWLVGARTHQPAEHTRTPGIVPLAKKVALTKLWFPSAERHLSFGGALEEGPLLRMF